MDAASAAPPPAAAAAIPVAAPTMLGVDGRVAIWAPTLVFSLLYAGFFLATALVTLNPKLWGDLLDAIRARLRLAPRGGAGGGRKGSSSSSPSASDAKAAADVSGTATLAPVATPVVLAWRGIGCSYPSPEGLKPVLQDVSGEARPGEMAALMGPSGSGKSTLIDMLAARKTLGRLTGRVTANGRAPGPGFRRLCSYVPQEDSLTPQLNVSETCAMYAAFTMPRGTPPAVAAARTDEVLAAMGIAHARDRLVGGVLPGGLLLRGLSGGERKRLWVAVGILATPSVVFLDEPTTGLDSCAAVAVVSLLRRTARDAGLTVVASVHQPCAAAFAAFDSVTLLARGLLMYHGPRVGLRDWFEGERGYGPWDATCHGTVSDWVMDLVSVEFAKPEGAGRAIESDAKLVEVAAAFSARYAAATADAAAAEAGDASSNGSAGGGGSARNGHRANGHSHHANGHHANGAPADVAAAAAADCGDDVAAGKAFDQSRAAANGSGAVAKSAHWWPRRGGGASVSPDASPRTAASEAPSTLSRAAAAFAARAPCCGGEGLPPGLQRAGWWVQFKTLLWREALSMMRNPVDVAGRMLCFSLLAVLTGLVFWNLDEGIDGTRNRVNVLFLHVTFLLLMPFLYMTLYASDKRTCVQDFSGRLYSVSAYYAAKQVAVLPFLAANLLVTDLIAVGMVGMRTDPAALATLVGLSIVFYLLAQQVQSLVVILTPNQEAAFSVSIGFTAVQLLMSNYVIRFQDMQQHWISHLRWISACNFYFAALLKNQFEGTYVSCAAGLNPSLLSMLRRLMPTSALIRSPVAARALTQPGPDCVLDLGAVLEYFDVRQPMWVYGLSLAAYLLILHGLTFWALMALARKERR